MTDLLLAPGLPLLIGAGVLLLATGLIVAYAGAQRSSKPQTWGGLAVALLAILWAVIATLVVTPIESAVARTRGIVGAVEQHDFQRLDTLIDDTTSFSGVLVGRDQVLAGFEVGVDSAGLTEARVTSLNAERAQTSIVVDIDVLSRQDVTAEYPYPSSWRFTFTEFADGWVLETIDPTGQSEQVRSRIDRHVAGFERLLDRSPDANDTP